MSRAEWVVELPENRWARTKAVEADIEEGGTLTFRDGDGVIVAAFAGGAKPAWVSVRRES